MRKEQKKNIVIYSFSGMLLMMLMIFSGVKNNKRTIEKMEVDIAEEDGMMFTNEREVMSLITDQNREYVLGIKASTIDPKTLEDRVHQNPFVKDVQVYRDVRGNLEVKVIQSKPIARVYSNGRSDKYIDANGRILPTKAKQTARVPILETEFDFNWEENMLESSFGTQVFDLLNYIEQDPFWKAQIAQIVAKSNGEVELYPQVTKQKIEFGKPQDFEEKFSKLMIFYKEILPKKGWNEYEKVNIKFKDQIICE